MDKKFKYSDCTNKIQEGYPMTYVSMSLEEILKKRNYWEEILIKAEQDFLSFD